MYHLVLLDSFLLLKFFRFDLNFIHCPTASWNVSDFDSCSSRKLFFENSGHFELPLSLRGKHALGTVEKRKPAGSTEQRCCWGWAPCCRAQLMWPAVLGRRVILWTLFSPVLFLLSFQDSGEMNVRSFVIIPQDPEALLFFSVYFSLYCSDWVMPIVLSSSALIISSFFYILLFSPTTEFFFFFGTVLFSSKIALWFFFISSVSLLRLFFPLICFKWGCNCSLKHLKSDECFKIFVR